MRLQHTTIVIPPLTLLIVSKRVHCVDVPDAILSIFRMSLLAFKSRESASCLHSGCNSAYIPDVDFDWEYNGNASVYITDAILFMSWMSFCVYSGCHCFIVRMSFCLYSGCRFYLKIHWESSCLYPGRHFVFIPDAMLSRSRMSFSFDIPDVAVA